MYCVEEDLERLCAAPWVPLCHNAVGFTRTVVVIAIGLMEFEKRALEKDQNVNSETNHNLVSPSSSSILYVLASELTSLRSRCSNVGSRLSKLPDGCLLIPILQARHESVVCVQLHYARGVIARPSNSLFSVQSSGEEHKMTHARTFKLKPT